MSDYKARGLWKQTKDKQKGKGWGTEDINSTQCVKQVKKEIWLWFPVGVKLKAA